MVDGEDIWDSLAAEWNYRKVGHLLELRMLIFVSLQPFGKEIFEYDHAVSQQWKQGETYYLVVY